MDFNRRTAMAAGLGAMVAGSGGTARAAAPMSVTVTVQGESAVRTNIPVVRDRRAAGGRYLRLRTTGKPPARTGWYATYSVRAPRAGVYALTAVATAPVETPHAEAVASYLHLSVNDGPFTEIARSQPRRAGSRLSPAEHIVLAQRFPARNAAPGKQDGVPPPHGYRLGRRTRMTVDVYNFDDTAHRVSVSAPPMGGGWTVRADQGQGQTCRRVPAGGRAGVNFTVLAGSSVPRRTDRRPAFQATADDDAEVPASVALIHRG
ncbi:hypothetical protein ACFY64_31260 [Streptomyces collinus]|uniref:hypothetical protein n=1 Tax=Streptomyces collinus TaxID=42684 RepID=UPI0036A1D653